MSGLNDNYNYYEFELDSADATVSQSSTSTSLDWPLFSIGGKKPLSNIAGIKIIECQIPFTWYAVNSYNYSFTLALNSQTAVINLPIGNFTSSTIIPALTAALNGGAINCGTTDTFTVTYSSLTAKLTIVSSSITNVFQLIFTGILGGNANDPANTNPRNILGFNGGFNTSQAGVSFQTLVAPNVAQITGPNYLYINSQKIGNLVSLYLPAGAPNLGSGDGSTQIAKIPINVNPGGVIFWSDPDPTKYFDLGNLASLSEIDLFLTLGNTSAQTPLQLNGASISVKLGVLELDLTQSKIGFGKANDQRVIKRVKFS